MRSPSVAFPLPTLWCCKSRIGSPNSATPSIRRSGCAGCCPARRLLPQTEFFALERAHLLDIELRVELAAGACAGHVSNFAEYRPLAPGAVELAYNGPRDAGVAVRIAAVEEVFVIEVHCALECRFDVRRPFQNLLGPVHAHDIVHPADMRHLRLRSVP